MSKIISIEPAIDPTARPTFLLDWELTLKCNLDCSYCPSTGEHRAHDNSRPHPPLQKCLDTIDFMLAYADLYMERKPSWTRMVVLNVYGGESLFHPDIVEILKEIKKRHQAYQQCWPLTVTCTTNGVVGQRLLDSVIDYVDEFTVSYHCETLAKQKQQVLDNLAAIKANDKRLKCIVLMHGDENKWPELLSVIDFCRQNNINYLPKQLDGDVNSNYNQSQIVWFKNMWNDKTLTKAKEKQQDSLAHKNFDNEQTQLSDVGRACCGGRLMCTNQDLKHNIFYIPDNNFHGWRCAVNWFFLFIRQDTGEIFSNKDCRMNFDGTVSPLGYLDKWQELLLETKRRLDSDLLPAMTCAKSRCLCGLCAPKARTQEDFIKIMDKHVRPLVSSTKTLV